MKALHILPLVPILLTACSSMQRTAEVRDGVYDKPVAEPVAAVAPAQEQPQKSEDYYDANTASQYQRGYYDMTYNDPYYYNYGRFGWGGSVGVGNAWGSPCGGGSSWSMNYGWGSPYGSSWGYDNTWGSPYGSYGYPYGGWNSPYGYGGCGGGYDPYGGYYGNGYYNGYGYYGSGGGCYSCYQPIVICDGGGDHVYRHRPSMGAGGGTTGSTGESFAPTFSSRSAVSLRPVAMRTIRPELNMRPDLSGTYAPGQTRPVNPGLNTGTRDRDHVRTVDHGNAPSRGGNDGGGSSPSRDGGGSRDSGGSRSTPGTRPR